MAITTTTAATTTNTTTKVENPAVTAAWAYLVVSLSSYGDPCGPSVEGVFSTLALAQERATAVFDDSEDGHRLGYEHRIKDDSNSMEQLFSKTNGEFSTRCLLNVVGEEDGCDEMTGASVVAIVKVQLNKATVHHEIPLLTNGENGSTEHPEANASVGTNGKEIGGKQVFVLMNHAPGNKGGDCDVDLLGIFTTKEATLARAKSYMVSNKYLDDREMTDNSATVSDSGLIYREGDEDMGDGAGDGEFFVVMDSCVVDAKSKEGAGEFQWEIFPPCGPQIEYEPIEDNDGDSDDEDDDGSSGNKSKRRRKN